jgi:pyrroloquinoline quinone (PQQ) biosynthesis protein C
MGGASKPLAGEVGLAPAPVGDYLGELAALVAAHDWVAADRVVPAIAAGRATRDVTRRVALEAYYVAKWTTPDVAVLIANAPDVYGFTMDHTTHYRHWADRFAGVTGYRDEANEAQTALRWCRELGVTEDDVRAYTPLPETIATTFTRLFYVRRSYEEGLVVLGYADERVGAVAHARVLADGLAAHYGVGAARTPGGAGGGSEDGSAAALLRQVATTRTAQDRCRAALRNHLATAVARVRAMNRWVE